MLGKIFIAGRQVTHYADDIRIVFRQIEQPLIVFHERACFDNHRSGDP